MVKLRYIIASVVGAGALALGGVGIANAAVTHSGNVGTSGIPRATFRQDRLEAAAQVLNTTTANVQAAHKDKTLSTFISSAGLTRQSFAQKVRAAMTSELEGQGYSQQQATIAFQHRTILRLRHRLAHQA